MHIIIIIIITIIIIIIITIIIIIIITIKPDKEETARKVFAGTAVNVSSQGQRHLGAVLGSREYFEDYVNGKVEEWVSEVAKLSEFAATEPQAS